MLNPAPARPAWAAAFGLDAFGPFADLDVSGVIQRFRWCPPGRFLMGSPEGEAGRLDWEGPQHEVTLSSGFWMADSPVTQALYLGLTGEDPSRFANPARRDRPVEMVSWDDGHALCSAIEEHLQRAGLADDGLVFRLPTEAEWEYACRAGTSTATYAGELTLRGQNDAPELDPIAWYGGNSGLRYEQGGGGGVDSRGWPHKQHPHTVAGTRVVKQRAPNPWGLYDTLGNVWEWCADAWDGREGYPEGARLPGRVDPLRLAGARRARRGGAWNAYGEEVRAAVRLGCGPADRFRNLGLRLCCGRAFRTSQREGPSLEPG